MAAIIPLSDRLRVLDLVHPWLYTPAAFLFPMPETSQNNIDAVIKPFQLWVCSLIVITIYERNNFSKKK